MPDTTGYKTLLAVAEADKLNRWMYETIRPYSSGHILEIGSGIGNISSFFAAAGADITLSDIDPDYVSLLRKRFQYNKNVNDYLHIDLQKTDFPVHYSDIQEKFDTVFLLNVLEHLRDESLALHNLHFLLKEKGTLIILVPAYSFLFSELDRQLGHCRRYTQKTITHAILKNNFVLKKAFYFNLTGVPAWLLGKIKGQKTLYNNQMKLYNRLIPFAKLFDRITFNKAGLSVVAVAEKQLTK